MLSSGSWAEQALTSSLPPESQPSTLSSLSRPPAKAEAASSPLPTSSRARIAHGWIKALSPEPQASFCFNSSCPFFPTTHIHHSLQPAPQPSNTQLSGSLWMASSWASSETDLLPKPSLEGPSQPAPSLQITGFITELAAALNNQTLDGDASVPRDGCKAACSLGSCFLLLFPR